MSSRSPAADDGSTIWGFGKGTCTTCTEPVILWNSTTSPGVCLKHYNEQVRRLVNGRMRSIVLSSYLYYELDISWWPDAYFDQMCATAAKQYHLADPYWQALISEDDLKAGTGFAIKYPPELVTEALRLKESMK